MAFRLRSAIKRITALYESARLLIRLVAWLQWRVRVQIRKRHSKLDFDRLFWVSPKQIELCTPFEFDPIRCDGAVVTGDWDVTDVRFSELDVFVAFRAHFLDGTPWQQTQFFQNTVSRIESGLFLWGCANSEAFQGRLAVLDRLYQQIREQGYRPQSENIRGFLGTARIDEVSVNLSRDGDLLFNNGAHRLAIAKLLGIPRIPVRVTVCHAACTDPQGSMALHCSTKGITELGR